MDSIPSGISAKRSCVDWSQGLSKGTSNARLEEEGWLRCWACESRGTKTQEKSEIARKNQKRKLSERKRENLINSHLKH